MAGLSEEGLFVSWNDGQLVLEGSDQLAPVYSSLCAWMLTKQN